VDAHYSAELFDVHIAAKPTQRRYIFVSAAKLDPAGLADLTGNAAVATITFDLTTLKLPVSEKNRVVTNLVCFLAGKSPDVFEATMGIMKPATDVQVTFQQGLAMSTAPPLVPAGSVSSPLNSLIGKDATQAFTLSIHKTTSTNVDLTGVTDVVLGVEYQAEYV
jgi:hypothetical protein